MAIDWRKALMPILVVSLGANLFLGGYLWSSRSGNPLSATAHAAPGSPLVMGWGSLKGSAEGLKMARKVWIEKKGEVHQAMMALHERRDEVLKTLQAPLLDRPLLEKRLEALRQQTLVAQQAWHSVLVETAQALPATERGLLGLSGGGRRHSGRMSLQDNLETKAFP
ncbi:MAG: periplasmic heavy metal sensor [Magnetococcales bacterium]|nr:periplasmic heavy metal sensor [Magnetococcales bacterium]